MLTAKIIKKGNSLERAIKHLEASRPYVEVGVFEEQGQHPTAEMTYVELLRYHASPEPNTPTRDVLYVLSQAMSISDLKFPEVKSAIKRWASRPFSKQSDKLLMDDIGSFLRDLGRDFIFGSTSALAPNAGLTIALKGRDEPLVDDGHLRDAFAFKNSIDKIVREG